MNSQAIAYQLRRKFKQTTLAQEAAELMNNLPTPEEMEILLPLGYGAATAQQQRKASEFIIKITEDKKLLKESLETIDRMPFQTINEVAEFAKNKLSALGE